MPPKHSGPKALAHDKGKINAMLEASAKAKARDNANPDGGADADGDKDSGGGSGSGSGKDAAKGEAKANDGQDGQKDDDDDPITASYPVFLNPSLPLGRRLLVLQHPNRTDDAPRAPPSELRLKPRAGMVEVDVPIDHAASYDRDKGLRWGRSLHASMAAKNGGSHGLAGGFGFGAVPPRGGAKKRAGDIDDDEAGLDWNEAMRQNKVLTTQTLGGQYPDADEVQYMVGVFQGKDLHLTPVSSLIHLRPQLHHLDATTQLERQATSSGTKEAAASSGAGAPSSAAAAGPGGNSGARAIHMTIKTTADGDAVTTETMADRLRSVQSEPWRKMRYTDENDEAAWDVYNESLFLRPRPDDAAATAQPDLEANVPRFATRWRDKELLEAVSGITKAEPAPESATPPPPPEVKPDPEADAPKAEEARKPRGRTRGGAAAPRRGGRASKATASKSSSAINID